MTVHWYLVRIGNKSLLAHEEEIELAKRSEQGDEDAKRERIESNLKLVINTATKCVARGCDLDDLIQEGILGLMKAVEKFDDRKKIKFSTYATPWIRQAITRAIANQASAVRITVFMKERFNELSRQIRELEQM